MMQPDDTARLGSSEDFPAHDDHHAIQIAARLRCLGVAHVRVDLIWTDYVTPQGAAWYGRLLSTLAGACTILLRLHHEPEYGDDAFVRFLEHAMPALAPSIDAIEIDIPVADGWGANLIRAAADLAHDAGARVALSVPAQRGESWLGWLGERGALAAVDAVGVTPAGVTLHRAARAHNPDIAVWITRPDEPGGGRDEPAMAHRFAAALELPAARLYWPDLARQETLLGRLLAHGPAAVIRTLHNPAPAIMGVRPILVTGGAGFIGANLADRLARDGHHVLLYDALSRPGVERNLEWLKISHPGRIAVAVADLRDQPALTGAVRDAGAVFHLAAQVAVTTSLVAPLQDFDINLRGTLTILEALRRFNPAAPLLFASTNKVYGDLSDIALTRHGEQYVPDDSEIRRRGIDETRPLCFHTPYGCSKGAADQYVLDYAHSFGLQATVLRMSCIYGERQWGTEDQGWLAHFLLRAIAGEPITLYGDGCQVRDVLHIDDAVQTYIAAWQAIGRMTGRAFNLGGGPANAISLRQLIAHIEQLIGRSVEVDFQDWRAGDQRYFVADAGAVRSLLGSPDPLGWREGVARLAAHFGAGAPARTDRVHAL